MFKEILVAVDGSPHALKAAEIAGEMARVFKSDIYLVTAYDPVPSYLGDPYFQKALDKRVAPAEKIITDAKGKIGEIPGKLSTELLEGHPAEAILDVAETRKVELIVMGTRGLGRLKGALQGSQSQKVAAHANCPVLLVR